MYTIKEKPEDFIVEEVPIIKLSNEGKHAVYEMTKIEISTQQAIESIKKRFKLKNRQIGYAGSKDKKAVTKQWISIKWNKKEEEINVSERIKLKLLGRTDERILLGNLKGNRFKIKIRNLDKEKVKNLKALKEKNIKKILMPNYFGSQRFSRNNEKIGELIIKRKFKEAVELISKTENKVKERLQNEKYRNDFLGAIRTIPRQTAMMYIHSFQSSIFNKTLNNIIEKNCEDLFEINIGNKIVKSSQNLKKLENIKIPIVGFGTKTEKFNRETREEILKIMKKLGIKEKDFLIREAPDLSAEGTERKSTATIENLKIETNENEKTAELEFELDKGSYATIAIEQIIKTKL